MTDVKKMIDEAVAEAMKPEVVMPKLQEAADKMVDELIKDSFRPFSEMRKKAEEAMAEALELTELNLPAYGTNVMTMLEKLLEKKTSELVDGQLKDDMEKMLGMAPKELKLSSIVREMVESSYADDWENCVTCIVEDANRGRYWIYLDENSHYCENEKYRADIRLLVDENGKIDSGLTSDYRSKGRDLTTSNDFGRPFSLDQKVRSWYACGTRIIVDQEEFVLNKAEMRL